MKNFLLKQANGFDVPVGAPKKRIDGFYPEAVGGGWNPSDGDDLMSTYSKQLGGYFGTNRSPDKVKEYIEEVYRGTQDPAPKLEHKPSDTVKSVKQGKAKRAAAALLPKRNEQIHQLSADYNRKHGLADPTHYGYVEVDESEAQEVADAYDNLIHDPSNPEVQRSYQALCRELMQQWHHAVDAGFVFEPWSKPDSQPYQSSGEMVQDIEENNHLYYFTGGELPPGHPMADVDPQTGLTYNEIFRGAHDFYGHAKGGYQFGPRGEENAFKSHREMFSDDAIPALMTETKGQNSWVNHGKHMRGPDGKTRKKGDQGWVHPADRPYADQKAALLPQSRNELRKKSAAPISSIHGLPVLATTRVAWGRAIRKGHLQFNGKRYSFSEESNDIVRRLKPVLSSVNSALNRKHVPDTAKAHEMAVQALANKISHDTLTLDKVAVFAESLIKEASYDSHIGHSLSDKVHFANSLLLPKVALNIPRLVKDFGNTLVSRYKQEHPNTDPSPEQVIQDIKRYDPSKSGEYTAWMVGQYARGGNPNFKDKGIRRFEDFASRIAPALKRYDQLKSSGKLPVQERDIAKLHGSAALEQLVDKYKGEDTTSNRQNKTNKEKELIASGQAEVVLNDSKYKIVIPRSEEAAKYFGVNTKWCTAAEEHNRFSQYENDPLYITLVKTENKRFQFAFPSAQFMDERDVPIDVPRFCREYPELAIFFGEVAEDSRCVCSTCNGNGVTDCYKCDGDGYEQCEECGGSGTYSCAVCDGLGEVEAYNEETGEEDTEECSDCSGSGETECPECEGTGREDCNGCDGEGTYQCSDCDGSGESPNSEEFKAGARRAMSKKLDNVQDVT